MKKSVPNVKVGNEYQVVITQMQDGSNLVTLTSGSSCRSSWK